MLIQMSVQPYPEIYMANLPYPIRQSSFCPKENFSKPFPILLIVLNLVSIFLM